MKQTQLYITAATNGFVVNKQWFEQSGEGENTYDQARQDVYVFAKWDEVLDWLKDNSIEVNNG